MTWIKELWAFTWKQALCCIFPIIIFSALAITKVVTLPGIHRYDLILLICLAAQAVFLRLRLETWDEFKVILLFHLIGLGLELFKVHHGSWSYPGEAWSKVGGVPLYSGFMYASVASYVCQAWRRLELRFLNWPNLTTALVLSLLIYLNFFTHHYLPDIRWPLTIALIFVFSRSQVIFRVTRRVYRMPMPLSFLLISLFIWLAENISTFLGAWQYPNQALTWRLVHLGKMHSWFLLVIISIIIVAHLKHYKSASGRSLRPEALPAQDWNEEDRMLNRPIHPLNKGKADAK